MDAPPCVECKHCYRAWQNFFKRSCRKSRRLRYDTVTGKTHLRGPSDCEFHRPLVCKGSGFQHKDN